ARWAGAESDYFETHPSHIMGEVSKGSGQWGSDEIRGTAKAEDIEAIIKAFAPEKPLDAEYQEAREQFPLPEKQETQDFLYPDASEVKALQEKQLLPGMIKTAETAVYILSGDRVWSLAAKNDRPLAKRLDLVKTIANEMKSIRSMMREGKDVALYQKVAKESLTFYKNQFGSYPPEDKQLLRFLKNNPAVSGLFEGSIAPEADILNVPNLYDKTGNLINGHNEAVHALQTLQEEMRETTEDSILQYFPDNGAELVNEMYRNPDIFLALDNSFLLREDFISGNAWEKIDAIDAAAGTITDAIKKTKILYGKTELEKAAGWVPIEDADFTPHSSWIPEYIINHWLEDEDGLKEDDLSNRYQKVSKSSEGKWGIKQREDREPYSDSDKDVIYDGEWFEEANPVVYYLNMQKQRSRYYDTETFNREHNENFKNYIANHKEFRDELEKRFNRIFNAELSGPVKTYPIYLEGWQEENKTLRGHQWQSIHHLYRQGKGISALGTGFGKTLAATGLHALLKQEGKIKRAWFQVPNNKVKDWVRDIHEVLPDRKIGFVDPEMRGYSNREVRYALYQNLANSDYDIILMPESAASEIQLNAENDRRITSEVVSKHVSEKGEGKSVRKKEQIKESSARSLENGKTNKTIAFEDFGCNAIFVDEAHRYKNLFSSNLSRETGLNDGRQSAKAMALFKKTEYIRRNNDGKNIFLLTATPLTNSPLEYYNMLMYVAPEELEKFHIKTIDGFIKNFANIETGLTYDWKTGQVGEKRILTGFKNIQTLQNIFFKYTDYQNDPVKINLDKPDAFNKLNLIPADEQQSKVVKDISAELEQYRQTPKEDREALYPGQNFLTFYSQLRTASLDLELFDPNAHRDWKNPKLEQLSENTWKIYQNTKAGQAVFCDRVFSSDASFDIHQKIKKSLVNIGFKDGEIVIVNGFTKSGGAQSDSQVEKEVSQAVEKFNNGTYKILIGSTACIGEGLNLQENSAALHHFDIPFRPSDFIQRNGRIDRQGNSQDAVDLHTYMSAGTIDNYSVSLVQRKANWIDQLLKTKSHVFVNPNDENFVDADELLLALTEEWGDARGAEARREEM
ncbi:MAG: DEAD/DEAH box helicase family protein, partial [Treponema sp.]|nr:DEAD/DEAH box helicase family protein [Treponema sp.]